MTDIDNETLTFASAADALAFAPRQRVEFRPRASWRVRVWRWITKRNYRVATVDAGTYTITLERCR